MRKISSLFLLVVPVAVLLGSVTQSAAESAEVLPKGVFRAAVETNLYRPITKRFGRDGQTESVDTDFNAVLNGDIFQDLFAVDEALGLPPGTSNVGTSVVQFQYQFTDLIFHLHYGLTDNVSIGVKVPYYWSATELKELRLDTTGATVGIDTATGEFGLIGAPNVVPLTIDDIQNVLVGLGYKPVNSWSGSGFSDIELGLRYRYYETPNWRLAFTGAVRLPTGKVDDPDNLMDIGFGTGAWGLLFRLNNDYTGIKDLVLNGTIKYDVILPNRQVKRIPDEPGQVITPEANKEDVKIDQGDVLTLNASGKYEFYSGFQLFLEYEFGEKGKDRVSGGRDLNYSAAEDQTNWGYQKFKVGLSYTTIPLFTEKKFPLPLEVSVGYEDIFAGKNKFLKQQSCNIILSLYF